MRVFLNEELGQDAKLLKSLRTRVKTLHQRDMKIGSWTSEKKIFVTLILAPS